MDKTKCKNSQNIDWLNIQLLQDAAVGFLSDCILLSKQLYKKEGNVLYNMRLIIPYHSNLLFSVELFFKTLLLIEGHKLDKIKTHKIYDLYQKLNRKTQEEIETAINKKHFVSLGNMSLNNKPLTILENVLFCNNDSLIRWRYVDLNKSASLSSKGHDVLLELALFLCANKEFNLKRYGSTWISPI